ncbi:MAG: PQQ-binding-like beta-propeller repeat protein [Kiritimatiellia bacterium]
MRPGLLKPKTSHTGWRAAFFACLAGAAGLGGYGARAQEVPAGDEPFVKNAVVEVDAEVNLWLARASVAMRSETPDNALPLLLRVWQSDTQTMASTNGVTFQPAWKLAGKLIRALPERTLAAHRLRADISTSSPADRAARSIDLATLEEAYRKALPDAGAAETGLRLASLYLDQERFLDARRMLRDMLDEYPAGRGVRAELLARLLVACARVGDAGQAQWAWSQLQQQGDTNRWTSLSAEIRAGTTSATSASHGWTLPDGGALREAETAKAALDFATNSGWVLNWGLNLGPDLGQDGSKADGPTNPLSPFSLSRAHMAACMLDRNMRPAETLIFSGNRAWVNNLDEFTVVDLDTGHVMQRMAHVTNSTPDIAVFGNVVVQFGGVARGSSERAESWIFANRLNRAASLAGGRVFCIEGNSQSSRDQNMGGLRIMVNRKWATLPQTSGNALAAYATDTGNLLWRIGRELPSKAPPKERTSWLVNAIRFAAAPVPCASLLLAPVEDDAGLSVVALDPHNGVPVWWTQLAYGIAQTAPRATPLTITVEGAYAYLCGGNGSVSALDGCDGSVLWTTLYDPFDEPSATNRVSADVKVKSDTWEESLVLIAGDAAVALPEDSQELLAFDRRNGTWLWKQRKPDGVNYVLGRRDAALIVAGGRTVACVDLTDGQERWRTSIEGSTGRGTLCGQEVLIPSDRKIIRLRAEDGAVLGSMRAQRMDQLPLGNLYVNGDQLLVSGPERLYALVDARRELARMDERLARQPTAEAYAVRGRLYAEIERYAEAVADLRAAWKLRRGPSGEDSARGSLMTALWHAAEQNSGGAKAFHAEACALAVTAAEQAEATWRLAQHHERIGDTNGALALYVALLNAADVIISPNLGDSKWEVSARRLASRRIRLLAGEKDNAPAILEDAAVQTLARLGSAPGWTGLVELAMLFPGTVAGQNAARQAAQRAADRGDLGTAEAVLQRALAQARPADRDAVAGELVRLYERMKWSQGTVRLRDDWSRLFAGIRVPELLDRATTKAAQRTASVVAQPPWRLRWRIKLSRNLASFRITPAGLLYWTQDLKQTGCLAFDTGLPRWQKEVVISQTGQRGGQTSWDDVHIVPTVAGDSIASLDLWSGAVTTNALLRIDSANAYACMSQIGFASVGYAAGGGVLTSVDLLTGQVAWRRREMESLQGAGVSPMPLAYAPVGVFLMRCEPDGNGAFVTLDPWTGDVAFRRPITANRQDLGAIAKQGGMWSLAFPRTPEREIPVIADQRLSVRDRRTGLVLWTTPADLAIIRNQPMPSGAVLAQTADEEVLLLDGANGRIMCRAQGVRFAFDYARQSEGSDAVILSRRTGGGSNEVLVLDPSTNRIAFQGWHSQQINPLSSLGPTAPDQLLVSAYGYSAENNMLATRTGLQVINRQGEPINGWRLPRSEDLGEAARSGSLNTLFAEGLILMIDQSSGEALAYEHDPQKEHKQPGGH